MLFHPTLGVGNDRYVPTATPEYDRTEKHNKEEVLSQETSKKSMLDRKCSKNGLANASNRLKNILRDIVLRQYAKIFFYKIYRTN